MPQGIGKPRQPSRDLQVKEATRHVAGPQTAQAHFFSAGVHHHDVSCELARAEGPGPQPKGVPGLYHVAFAVGASLDELAEARRWVESHGLTPFGEYERGFCVRDPDGHEVELYVEAARP